MFKKNLFLLLLSCSLLNAEIKELAHMEDLCSSLPEVSEGQKLLFFFDIDDTLITSKQVIGGNPFFYSELEKESNIPGADKEAAFKKIIILCAHIEQYSPVKAVEEDTPAIILVLQLLGVPCMGLTARSLEAWIKTPISRADRTIQQLEEVEIDFSRTALSETDLDLSDTPEKTARYTRGIIFNGQNNKGEMLLKYLAAIDYHPDLVVYVDDSARHVKAVHDALQAAGITCMAFRYSAMDEVNKNFDDTLAQQELEAFLLEHPLVAAAA